MSQTPGDRRYTTDHEWIKIDGDVALVGITDFAQSELGDVTYVEVPQVGRELAGVQIQPILVELEGHRAISHPIEVKAIPGRARSPADFI